MQVACWNITGNTFHFGRRGLGLEETAVNMTSDSLFAALISRLARKDGSAAVDQWMAPFLAGRPPFTITSTFPFAGQVRFFPTPANVLQQEVKGVRPKDLKRVVFVSESLFKKLLQGQLLGNLYPQALSLQGGRVLVDPSEKSKLPASVNAGEVLWAIERRPRVTLGRAIQNSNLFFTGQVSFAAGCGLWFGLRWLDPAPALKAQVDRLLEDLADAGLGADRTAGLGACQIVAAQALELPDPDGKRWLTLSSYLPTKDEMPALQHEQALYQIQPVGGWLDSPVSSGYRRRTVNLLIEGSVFGSLATPAVGRVVDVHPRDETNVNPLGHSVYRSGLAFAVGMEGARA